MGLYVLQIRRGVAPREGPKAHAAGMRCYQSLVSFNAGNVGPAQCALFNSVTSRPQAGPALLLRVMLAALAISSFQTVALHAESAADPMGILPAPPMETPSPDPA